MRSSWYAVHVRSRHEFKVRESLEAKGIETFLPTVERLRQWKDREKKVLFPLFSGYLFVRLEDIESSFLHVVKTSGVLRILGNGSFFIPVPEDQIQNLYALVTSKLPLEDHPYLKEGQRVVISSGPLRGVKGVLVRKEQERILVVSVDLIQKGVSVKVAADAVEPLLSE